MLGCTLDIIFLVLEVVCARSVNIVVVVCSIAIIVVKSKETMVVALPYTQVSL